jgi:hypothetical protein
MSARRWTASAGSFMAYSMKPLEVSKGEEDVRCGANG